MNARARSGLQSCGGFVLAFKKLHTRGFLQLMAGRRTAKHQDAPAFLYEKELANPVQHSTKPVVKS